MAMLGIPSATRMLQQLGPQLDTAAPTVTTIAPEFYYSAMLQVNAFISEQVLHLYQSYGLLAQISQTDSQQDKDESSTQHNTMKPSEEFIHGNEKLRQLTKDLGYLMSYQQNLLFLLDRIGNGVTSALSMNTLQSTAKVLGNRLAQFKQRLEQSGMKPNPSTNRQKNELTDTFNHVSRLQRSINERLGLAPTNRPSHTRKEEEQQNFQFRGPRPRLF